MADIVNKTPRMPHIEVPSMEMLHIEVPSMEMLHIEVPSMEMPHIDIQSMGILDSSHTCKTIAKFSDVSTDFKNLSISAQNQAPLLVHPSPILRTESFFLEMSVDELDPYKSFSNALGKSDECSTRDIDFISKQKNDFAFNTLAYPLLNKLEIHLRSLITEKMIRPKLCDRFPDGIEDKWKNRKKMDEKNTRSDAEYELIDYSDFTDLKEIFQKGRNNELFKDIYSLEQIKAIQTKLHELDPIRKKIAHNRPISEEELARLKLYSDDILPEQSEDKKRQ